MNAIIKYQHEKLIKQSIIIGNKQAIIDIQRRMQKVNEQRIRELESELEYQKRLVTVFDEAFCEAYEPKEDAETIGRLVREIAGHTE